LILNEGNSEMVRFLTFIIVVVGLAVYYYLTNRPKREFIPKPKQTKKISSGQNMLGDDIWIQVYDTDSKEEAFKIQLKFKDLGIQCFLYEQGKKDVFGNIPKHYGISVPHQHAQKAQSILSEFTL